MGHVWFSVVFFSVYISLSKSTVI